MSNKPLKNNSKLLYLQAKYQFEKAKRKFEDGSIKSETKLIQTVFQAFQDFFVSVGKPMMTPRYAVDGGPPWSEDFNNMMDEIKQDLELLFQEVDIIGRALYTDFNHNMVQQSMLQMEYDQVADKLKDLEILSSNLSANGRIVFCRNDFANKDKIDFDRITGIPAHIENGAVTLKRKNQTNRSQGATVSIVPGNKTYKNFILGSESNGFPGNNAEITVSPGNTMTGDYVYRFIGEKNNHGAYGAVLDGDANTWFEYELVNVREHDKQTVAKNLGWDYQVHGNQKLRWARDPENGVLKLHLRVVLPEVALINHINVNMYTPPNHGAKPAIIKDVLVSDGTNAPESVLLPSKKDDDYSFYFPPRKGKVVSILFEQPEKYFTDVGHIYYEEKRQIENGPDYVFDTINKQYTPNHLPRVEGPDISLQDLGIMVKTDQASIDAYYEPQGAGVVSQSMERIINNVSYSLNDENIDMGIERFEGWRYCIGIRDIEIFSTEYEASGELVTEPYYFDQPLEKISLEVSEEGPQYLKYFISIDDGANWHPISPLHRQTYVNPEEPEPPKIYTIQLIDKANQKANPRPGYLETETPVYSVRFRALLTRPEEKQDYGFLQTFAAKPSNDEIDYGTPILRSFNIKAYLQGEAVDSQASSRTVGGEPVGREDEIIDPPYFPPVPPETDPGEVPEPPEGYEPPPPVDGEDPPPDPNFPKLNVRITNKATSHCFGDNLNINGVVDGPYPITKVVLLINGEPKGEKMASGEVNEMPFNFTIPTDGYAIGDSFAIEVKGYDNRGSVDSDSFILTLKDCSIPPEPVKYRNCLQFDILTVQYYNEDSQTIENMEIPYDWLPYEIDNGKGDKLTFAWNKDSNGLIVMITESYDSSGQVFQLSSIGINYLDEYNQPGMTWATAIAAASDGVKNTHLMIGDPDSKDLSWVTAAKNGDYTSAPAIGGQNDYIIFRFSEAFNSHHCPINQNFKPADNSRDVDYTNPPIEPYDPEKGAQRDCLLWEGVIVQYYHPGTDKLERVVIPVADLGNTPLVIGQSKLMIGWSDYFDGVTVQLKQILEGAGSYNGHITGVGVKFNDYYGDKKEVWAKEITFASEGVMNHDEMFGEPKEYSALPWIPEVKTNNFANAPGFTQVGQYVAFKFTEEFTGKMCPVDSSKQNDDDIGIDPSNPPDVPHVYIEPFPYNSSNIPEYCQGENETFRVKGYAEDFSGLTEVRFHITGNQIDMTPYRITGTGQKRIDFDFTIPISSLPLGNKRVTGWATNVKGLGSPNAVTTPNKPFADFEIIDCSANITLTGPIRARADQAFTLSGDASSPSGIQAITIVDEYGSNVYTYTPSGFETSKSFSITIPANMWPGGTTKTYTATLHAAAGRNATKQHTVEIDDPPVTVSFINMGGLSCGNQDTPVRVVVSNTLHSVINITVTDQYGNVVFNGSGGPNNTKDFQFNLPANSYPIGTTVILTATARMSNGQTGTGTDQTKMIDCGASGTVYACGTQSQSGGAGVTRNYHNLGFEPGLVRIQYSMQSVPDQLDVYYRGQLVATTGRSVSGTGELTFYYNPTGDIYYCEVVVTGPNGTAWSYKVLCPQ